MTAAVGSAARYADRLEALADEMAWQIEPAQAVRLLFDAGARLAARQGMTAAPAPVSYADQLAAVEREIHLRRRLYPRRVMERKITQAFADQELRRMEAVAETLRHLAAGERLL